jgi:hypothetical protein
MIYLSCCASIHLNPILTGADKQGECWPNWDTHLFQDFECEPCLRFYHSKGFHLTQIYPCNIGVIQVPIYQASCHK